MYIRSSCSIWESWQWCVSCFSNLISFAFVCVSLSVCMFVRPNNNLVHNFIQSVQKFKKKKTSKTSRFRWLVHPRGPWSRSSRPSCATLRTPKDTNFRVLVTMLRLKQNSMFPWTFDSISTKARCFEIDFNVSLFEIEQNVARFSIFQTRQQ